MTEPTRPWFLPCVWCDYVIEIHNRGGRRGAGVEAAEMMTRHVARQHGKTWRQFLNFSGAEVEG